LYTALHPSTKFISCKRDGREGVRECDEDRRFDKKEAVRRRPSLATEVEEELASSRDSEVLARERWGILGDVTEE